MIASALATSSVTLSATTLVLVRLGETVSVAAVVPGSIVAEPEVVSLQADPVATFKKGTSETLQPVHVPAARLPSLRTKSLLQNLAPSAGGRVF